MFQLKQSCCGKYRTTNGGSQFLFSLPRAKASTETNTPHFTLRWTKQDTASHLGRSSTVKASRDRVLCTSLGPFQKSRDIQTVLNWLGWLLASSALHRNLEQTARSQGEPPPRLVGLRTYLLQARHVFASRAPPLPP